MTEERKILIRNNIVAVVGLFLVPLLIWGFGELRILIVGEPEHSWGSSLTSLYMPAIWFLLFGLIFLRPKTTFNSLSVLAVPIVAILFFWPAGIYALTIGMSELTAHWGFHARALIIMLGEISEAFMIFIPDVPGDPMSGGASGGYNFFSGGIAAGIYAAAYMYFGVGIRKFVLGLSAKRKNKSSTALATEEAIGSPISPLVESLESVEDSPLKGESTPAENVAAKSLRKPLLINNGIALISHFAISGLIFFFVLYLTGSEFRSIYLDQFEWIQVFLMTPLIFFNSVLPMFALHFIIGALLIKALPRLNFLSVISIVIFSLLFTVALPLLMIAFTFDDFAVSDIVWYTFYFMPSLALAFAMYIGVFLKALISRKFFQSNEGSQASESPYKQFSEQVDEQIGGQDSNTAVADEPEKVRTGEPLKSNDYKSGIKLL